jgi:branched-chain amino acid transport system substrate-binding protein
LERIGADRSVEFVLDLVAELLGTAPEDRKVWIEHEHSIYGTSIANRQKEALI